MAAKDVLGQQWKPRTVREFEGGYYPTKGWRKAPDKITATTRALGAMSNYDAIADARRKGITPNNN